MRIDDVSFNGLTLQEITDQGFPYHVTFLTGGWMEFNIRTDCEKREWMATNGLAYEVDAYNDVFGVNTDDPANLQLLEVWAFKDPNMAVLFKLTFV